jgi:hypothetical protein
MRKAAELIDALIDEHKLYRLEGGAGLRNLNQICAIIGYKEQPFAAGSPVELFLCDNPGAIDALIEFIIVYMTDEWADNIEAELISDTEAECEEE